jgi:Lon protease-like protein
MSGGLKELPLFPLNTVLFPGMTLPLRIFEPRYLQMVDRCVKGDPIFGVVYIKEGQEVGGPAIPHQVGTVARIIAVEKKGQGVLHITTVGEERFRVRKLQHSEPYLVGEVEPFPLEKMDAPEVEALVDVEIGLLSTYLELLSQVTDVEVRLQRAPEDPETIAYFVAMLLQAPLQIKQQLLSIADLPTLLNQEALLLQADLTALTVMLRGEEILDGAATPPLFSSS